MKHVAAWVSVMVAALSPVVAEAAGPIGDVTAGKAAFAQCSGCHSLMPGANGVGPSLNGVVGRPVASIGDYAYSPALQSGKGRIWSAASLEAFLTDPNAMFPGNKMGIAVADPKRRADIVGYLGTMPSK